MTLNLLYDGAKNPAGRWSDRQPLCTHVLRSRHPDIVGLQEATVRQLEDLTGSLPEYTVLPGPPSDGGRTLLRRTTPGEHCAILVRRGRVGIQEEDSFWISHRPERPGSMLPGALLPRVVHSARLTVDGARRIAFYCVHTDFAPWTWRTSLGILRRRLDREDAGLPQIVTGDFNVPQKSRAWDRLLLGGSEFCDAWLDAGERIGPEATYHRGYGRPGWPGRIDRILIRPSARVLSAETVTEHCGGAYPSDHYPVIAEIDSGSLGPCGPGDQVGR